MKWHISYAILPPLRLMSFAFSFNMDLQAPIFRECFQTAAEMKKTIDLDSTTVDEVEKTLAGSEYHMGDLVTDFRSIRDILYSYERHQHPSPDGQNTHLINKDELQTLLLIFCGIMKSMKKRETYLEAKAEGLQAKLDEQQMVQDDWVVVGKAEIPETATEDMKPKHWYKRQPWN